MAQRIEETPREKAQSTMEKRPVEPQLMRRRELARSPFGLMGRMMADLDRWFGDFGASPFARELATFTPSIPSRELAAWSPQIDVREQNGTLRVRADLPGIKAEDIKVDVENDALTLRGERKFETEEEREGMYFSERGYGRFERVIPLPEGVDANAIEARFDNGVLEISVQLPTAKPTAGTRIEVKSGGSSEATKSKTQH